MESLKLTSYIRERRRTGRDLAGNALLDLYATAEVAASIQFRGTQGSGLRQHLRSDRSLTPSGDLPLLTVAVDTVPGPAAPHRAARGGAGPRARRTRPGRPGVGL
jgi:PII-like signaling protein